MPALDLPLVAALVLAFAVLMYVSLDGFDLGLGILFPLAGDDAERDRMMNSVAPVWDGNETWLVLGGGGLFAAFPGAYAALLPAVYLPIMVMLVALVFRGVAFELRFKAERSKAVWDRAFWAGSTLATFAQGVVLGVFIQGVNISGHDFAGGAFDWLTPFSLMTGVALVAGYALLGATWLIMKANGPLQERAFVWARLSLFAVGGFVAVVSLWTPLASEAIARRWFSWSHLPWLAPIPLATGLLGLYVVRALARKQEHGPFLGSLGLFFLSYVGLGVSLFPYAVPRALTIWDTAAAPESLKLILIGVAVTVPAILAYTAYNYWVFRGKTGATGYH